ncbi:MAG: MlaD family protein [Deltaproteobacteria bacterium]
MSRHANPTLIGAFVLGALALGAIAVLLLAGGRWFQERRQYVLYFDGAAQGLQVGAPVVMLGVKVGSVKKIQLGLDPESHRFMVPVTIQLESHIVSSPSGEQIDLQDPKTIRQLIDRGLRGRLKVQSLLTGQLYVGLDFYPNTPARFVSHNPAIHEIPTIPTTVEELTNKLEAFPMDKFLANLASISSSINTILSSEAIKSIPKRLDITLANLESLTAKLDRASNPLLAEMRSDLVEMHKTLASVQTAVARIDNAADRLGGAADRVGTAADAATPLFKHMTTASDELARAARNLQDLANDNSPTVQHLNLAIEEISRSARALRLMANTIEQQPEALFRGKRSEE